MIEDQDVLAVRRQMERDKGNAEAKERVDHPSHYGGADNPYEHVKVVDAWGLNYRLASATKYICRHGKKPGVSAVEDLKKAAFWIQNEIERLERLRSAADSEC